VITENDVRPITSYGFSKLKSEEVVKDFCDTRIEYVILRPTAFFGENHLGSLYEMAKMIQRKNFVMIGNGRNHMNFLYVNDLTDILVRAVTECKMTNQIFLVADSPVKLKEFTNYTAKELGLEPSMFYIPKFVGLSAGFGFDVLSRILNRPMPLSVARVKNMTNDSRYSGAKLLELLSAKFQYGVYHGWTRTLNWYRSESLL
jgi:nucleoside-diphosphate-sugar epimerase